MKERLAALERIAAEKKQKEMQAIAAHKANQEESKSAPKVNTNYVGKAFDYCPPPPKATPSIPAPPKSGVKTFPISSGECPWMM